MATTDRQIVNGQTYMIMDSKARDDIAVINIKIDGFVVNDAYQYVDWEKGQTNSFYNGFNDPYPHDSNVHATYPIFAVQAGTYYFSDIADGLTAYVNPNFTFLKTGETVQKLADMQRNKDGSISLTGDTEIALTSYNALPGNKAPFVYFSEIKLPANYERLGDIYRQAIQKKLIPEGCMAGTNFVDCHRGHTNSYYLDYEHIYPHDSSIHATYPAFVVPAGKYYFSGPADGRTAYVNPNFTFLKTGSSVQRLLDMTRGDDGSITLTGDTEVHLTGYNILEEKKAPYVYFGTKPAGGYASNYFDNYFWEKMVKGNLFTSLMQDARQYVNWNQGRLDTYYADFNTIEGHGSHQFSTYPEFIVPAGTYYFGHRGGPIDGAGFINPNFTFFKTGNEEPVALKDYPVNADGSVTFKGQTAVHVTSMTKSAVTKAPYVWLSEFALSDENKVYGKIFGENGQTVTVDVNGGENFTKLTDALAYGMENPNTVIYVNPGVYDITQEIAITGTGPKIGNGTKLIFREGSKVLCHYTGGDASIESAFSPINGDASDFEIYNMNIETSKVRYCVHDDCSQINTPYTHRYVNCKMKQDVRGSYFQSPQCIGGGFGNHGMIEIVGGYYETVIPDEAQIRGEISYHNSLAYPEDAGTAISKLVIKDVYFKNGTAVVICVGAPTLKSPCFVSGCSMMEEPYVLWDQETWPYENMELIAWNNEIREQ